MAKTWYPVINYLACTECGTCVGNCPHGVYEPAKAPSPVVRNPEDCVDHCHGCGNRCPEGAISYVGDDTGWTPPAHTQKREASGCSCTANTVRIEYLYLDKKMCDRCIETDEVLDEVMFVLTPALQLAGYSAEYDKIEMATAERATQYRFLSSPTIRINGQDICATVKENSCGCCSDISGTDVDCRVFEYNGETYETPPKEMLARAIFGIVFGSSSAGCSCQSGNELPGNLKEFFAGKQSKPACSCDGNCC